MFSYMDILDEDYDVPDENVDPSVGNARVATSSGHTEVRATSFACGKFVGKVFFYSCVTIIGSALVKKLSLVLILT